MFESRPRNQLKGSVLIKENWDVKVLGRNETLLHFATLEDNPGMATAHHHISFIDAAKYRLYHPQEIPALCLHVNDIHPHQEKEHEHYVLFNASHARQIFDFADEHKIGEQFGRTLVQCVAGVSRSGATALALLANAGFSNDEAFERVLKVRQYIHPNIWFMEVFDFVMGRNGEFLQYYKDWYVQKQAEGFFSHVPIEKQYKF